MGTFSQPTLEKGSDVVQDFLCWACEDKKLEESADFYCESCMKFYCQKCADMHGQLFTNHSPHGRGDMKKWPVAKKVEDFLLKCDVHKEENIDMFCKDHSQLCCNKCVILNHRTCKTLMLLSDLVKNTPTDLKQVSVTIQTTLAEMKELQDNQEASIQSVQISFDEQLHKIQETREKIMAALKLLEKKTLREMKDTLTKLQAPLKRDVDKCSTLRGELKQLGDAIQDLSGKSKQELSLIASIKCQDKLQLFEKYQKENFVEVKSSINFRPNSEIVQYLSKLSGLGRIEHSGQTLTVQGNPDQVIKHSTQTLTVRGNPDQVIKHSAQTLTEQGSLDQVTRIGGKSEYDVHMQNDKLRCSIREMCVLPCGQVLVADLENNKIKLLNEQYQVVSHCKLSDEPMGICQITPSEVGVIAGAKVQFIKVNKSRLVKDRKLKLQHECYGIDFHEGDLFVTSGTALYKYLLSGKLVSKLHEDITDTRTVVRCRVSPMGIKLFITNPSQNKLLTLARDGSVLATFMDPELQRPYGINVTPAGQVLVCGRDSNIVIKLDSNGSRKLATLATERDGLQNPLSVCYNSNTDSIIVGLVDNNMILVFKV